MPVQVQSGLRQHKHQKLYPWRFMAVGQSFLALRSHDRHGREINYAGPANVRYKPRKFSQSKTTAGLRVWRIK
jgi:hypothetical protein